MSSVQRKRGMPARVWTRETVTDRRGNITIRPDQDSTPFEVRAAFIPQRGSRAEVPGQQQIDVVRMIVRHDLDNVGLWTLVEWQGDLWDVVAPPIYHHGSRHTRHWSIDIRRRPDG